MEKEFVPCEQVLALKELGFNEPCFVSICLDGSGEYVKADFPKGENFNMFDLYVSLPTFSQAFRWFREKHNLNSYVEDVFADGTLCYVYVINSNLDDAAINQDAKDTYEEAELECLKRLIEIVKMK